MKWKKVEGGYLVRLERGEDVLGTLTEFVGRRDIKSGTIQGLGAIKDLVLGIFDPEKKEYIKRTFEEDLELGNLTGNISILDGKPLLHCHVTAAGTDLKAYTGHLFSATVSVTGEFVITPFAEEITRAPDEDVGLNLLDL
ncbi:MAG: DNA-binding protein [Gemmatimonadota bacterium]|nr:MAG: DNA-binding protein [Gemmatimonadota bacterium]